MDSWSIFKRALRDTSAYMGVTWQSVVPIAYFIVGTFIHFIRFGMDEIVNEWQIFISYVVGPVIIFAITLFIWNLALAPFRILYESRIGEGGAAVANKVEQLKTISNFSAWDNVDVFSLWQAACLWAEKAPTWPLANDDEVAYFTMLRQAWKNKQILVTSDTYNRERKITFRPYRDVEFPRSELIKYAEKKGARPKFLYPEER